MGKGQKLDGRCSEVDEGFFSAKTSQSLRPLRLNLVLDRLTNLDISACRPISDPTNKACP